MAAPDYTKKRFNTPPPPGIGGTPMPPPAGAMSAPGGTGAPWQSPYPGISSSMPSGEQTLNRGGAGPAAAPPPTAPAASGSGGMDWPSVDFHFADAPDFAATDPAKSQADFTWGILQGIMSGRDLPFGAREINSEKAQAKTTSENTFAQAKDQIQTQQAQTGFASSPGAARPLVDARIGASQQYGKASNDIVQNAAQQNFNARLSALQGAQSWIDSLRSYVATMTGTWYQKEAAKAQLALAEANLAEQQRQFDITTGLNASR